MRRNSGQRSLARRTIPIVIACSLWPAIAQSELVVIYDSGNTKPLAPYLDVFGDQPQKRRSAPAASPQDSLGLADPSNLLPIHTPELTPGPVEARPLTLPNNGTLPRPFFFIGADRRSVEWFAEHRDRLESIGAIGMLVEATTESELRTIAQIAAGIPVLPAPATDIARSLGLKHIPVLISRLGIEQ